MSELSTHERRRASREAAERALAAREMRGRRVRRLGVAAAVAAALATAAAVVSSSGGPGAAAPRPAAPASLLAGIPERGGVLGDPQAPATVTEYLDLQCPACAMAARDTFPALVREVRAGRVKLAARTLHFLGPDSVRAARVAAGAERQGRLWAFVDAFYSSQGPENSGYVTDEFLREVARDAGVDAGAALEVADSAFAAGRLRRASADAAHAGVTATPTFTVRRGEGAERILAVDPTNPGSVTAVLAREAPR
jgi:protein-disulfide isomerase